jgi:hypothetical protein
LRARLLFVWWFGRTRESHEHEGALRERRNVNGRARRINKLLLVVVLLSLALAGTWLAHGPAANVADEDGE